MRQEFVKTKNIKNFILLLNSLLAAPQNVPKMALIYGVPGVGKSDAVKWWVTNNDAVYIRAMTGMTTRWLLEEIVRELDETPCFFQSRLVEQINNKFKNEPKMIIVDEVDYLLNDKKSIDILRDLHDKFNVPVVMVGMEMSKIKLRHNKPLYDRLYKTLKFEAFKRSDIEQILSHLTELSFTTEAVDFIFNYAKEFRQLVKIVDIIENIAKTNATSNFDIDTIRGFINYEKQTCKAS